MRRLLQILLGAIAAAVLVVCLLYAQSRELIALAEFEATRVLSDPELRDRIGVPKSVSVTSEVKCVDLDWAGCEVIAHAAVGHEGTFDVTAVSPACLAGIPLGFQRKHFENTPCDFLAPVTSPGSSAVN